MSVTRKQLYESVWSAPTGTAAAKYKVSGSFLARVCENLTVPRPPRGYCVAPLDLRYRAISSLFADLVSGGAGETA